MELQFTRRDFLRGSIVVALGAAGAGVLSSCGGAPAKAAGGSSTGSTGTSTSTSTGSASTAPEAAKPVMLHRGYTTAHGEKCFTEVEVATAEDGTILAAHVDEYQFLDADTPHIVPVPNSDKGFGEGYAEGKVLISKSMNGDEGGGYYEHMVTKAPEENKPAPTQPWLTSMKAIEAYAVGKKPGDLEKVQMDAVSGATLVDLPKYMTAIATIARDDALVVEGSYTGEGTDLKLGWVQAAAHGDKAFASAVSLVQGDTDVASSIDDFQFMQVDAAGLVPVPNSDKGLGKGYAEGVQLASKSVNSDMYSAMMKEKAQATTSWLSSMEAIEAYIAGKKIGEVKAAGPDAVSGATLVDTAGYVKAAADAAKSA